MKRRPPNRDEAETIALRGLGFLASDADRLNRFLTLSGLTPPELRERAREPDLLAGVLEHLLADETLLLMFVAEGHLPPEDVTHAHVLLAGLDWQDR